MMVTLHFLACASGRGAKRSAAERSLFVDIKPFSGVRAKTLNPPLPLARARK